MLEATSDIIYVRADVRPFWPEIEKAGGVVQALSQYVEFSEIFAPYFSGARPFWRQKVHGELFRNRTGALGNLISNYPESVRSAHPTHAFVGIGTCVSDVLALHTGTTPCFLPVAKLAKGHDFSMLLLGCTKSSPGFSTVHSAQHDLGLTQKHLIRFLYRWDIAGAGDSVRSRIGPEAPGCSMSFDRFYPYYEETGNLLTGKWGDAEWIFIKSARQALATETKLLQSNPRFVECGRSTCPTCRLRMY